MKQDIKNLKKTPRDINVPNNMQKTELKYLKQPLLGKEKTEKKDFAPKFLSVLISIK